MSTGPFELHMNTMDWNIADDRKENIGKSFVAPQVKAAVVGRNMGKIRLSSTAVYLQTIFLKAN